MASGIYYCNKCHFDVCHNCPDFLNLQLRCICPKCNQTIHYLHALTNPITGLYTCFKCENEYKDVDGVFMCENCEFLLCPHCEKEQRKKKLFKQLQTNSRNATPQKRELIEITSTPQKTNKFMENVKKGGLMLDHHIIVNEPYSDNLDKKYELPTFSGEKKINKEGSASAQPFGDRILETDSEKNFGEPSLLPYFYKEKLPWESDPSKQKQFLKFQKI